MVLTVLGFESIAAAEDASSRRGCDGRERLRRLLLHRRPRLLTTPRISIVAVLCTVAIPCSHAQGGEDLAQQLVNPFTTVIRLPVGLDYDKKIGPLDRGKAYALSIEPLVPIALNAQWSLISRTIVTAVAQKDVFPGAGSQSGLGDTLQSFFFSPRKQARAGTSWGAGPAILLPTATDDELGSKKWGLGPTGGVFHDVGPWTLGILAHHLWSVAGSGGASISSTFLQPALSYTTPADWTYTLQTEATYDWKARQWSVPLEASVAKLLKLGGQEVSLEAGLRYWAANPASGPKGWGLSFTATWAFPK